MKAIYLCKNCEKVFEIEVNGPVKSYPLNTTFQLDGYKHPNHLHKFWQHDCHGNGKVKGIAELVAVVDE